MRKSSSNLQTNHTQDKDHDISEVQPSRPSVWLATPANAKKRRKSPPYACVLSLQHNSRTALSEEVRNARRMLVRTSSGKAPYARDFHIQHREELTCKTFISIKQQHHSFSGYHKSHGQALYSPCHRGKHNGCTMEQKRINCAVLREVLEEWA